ncbi:MAG: hypothetical protein JWP57_4339 [Spirosoma sp.]|nr:hypothetical protein [Spirosoma sp.]
MRAFPLIYLPIFQAVLICLLHTGNSISYAQSTDTIKLCSETLHKNRQKIIESKSPNSQSLFPALDPTYQKLRQTYSDWEECVKGQKAPLLPFKTLSGESYDAASLAGKIVVVNFWFMSCAPCRAEMPALNKLVEAYKGKNVVFIGFSTDKADRLQPAFFEQNRFDFKVVAGALGLANSFQVMGYPTTYVIDQGGVIRQAWIGLDSATGQLNPYYKAKAAIDNLLAAAGK